MPTPILPYFQLKTACKRLKPKIFVTRNRMRTVVQPQLKFGETDGKASQVHAVGDGAEWIARQVDERFGSQGRYLVDFYHVCDYLSAAATVSILM